jgi:hypothetical protein
MTAPDPTRPGADPARPDPARPGLGGPDRRGWLQRRRDQVAEEIARNRRGEYKIPTWVLAVILFAFVAAWVALIILG